MIIFWPLPPRRLHPCSYPRTSHAGGSECKKKASFLTMAYTYEPLPLGEFIRILELNPGQGPITCRLWTSSLDEVSRSYEALSYVWGDPNNTVDITVNNKKFAVTLNLYTALHLIRHERAPRVLWIDAICISQKDHDERGRQVRIMKNIFEQAWRVPVCLGELPIQGMWRIARAR